MTKLMKNGCYFSGNVVYYKYRNQLKGATASESQRFKNFDFR